MCSPSKQIFVARPTKGASVIQGLFIWWVQAQDRSPDTPKNASDPVCIPSRRLVANLASRRSVRAHDRLPGIHVRWPRSIVTGFKTHPTWSVYERTQPPEVCPSPATKSMLVKKAPTFKNKYDERMFFLKHLKNFFTAFFESLSICTMAKAIFHLKGNVDTAFQPKRRMIFAALEPINKKLDRLETLGVILPIYYSEWTEPVMYV